MSCCLIVPQNRSSAAETAIRVRGIQTAAGRLDFPESTLYTQFCHQEVRKMSKFFRKLFGISHRPRVGLALSGGGARGLAHIGVLKVLEREGIPIGYLAGTSAGGLVAALYAAGLSAVEIAEEGLRLSSLRHLISLLDYCLPRRGLLSGDKMEEYLGQWLGDLTFDQLQLPLSLVTVDLNEGRKVVLREGPVLEAVRATIAVPGLLAPVVRNGQLLVDGGLLDNLPVDVVRQMGANVVIGVDISTDRAAMAAFGQTLQRHRFVPSGIVETMEILWRSLGILTWEVNRQVLEQAPPDLLIRPDIPEGITVLTGITRAAETIAAGERAAEQALPRLQQILQK